MQGTQVWSLVQKDPTCLRATKPKSQNYRSPCTITSEVTIMRRPGTAMESSPCSPQLEKWRAQQRKPSTAKKNNYKLSPKPSHAFLDSEELSLCLFNTFSFFRLQMKWPFLQTAPNITALCFCSPHPSSQRHFCLCNYLPSWTVGSKRVGYAHLIHCLHPIPSWAH